MAVHETTRGEVRQVDLTASDAGADEGSFVRRRRDHHGAAIRGMPETQRRGMRGPRRERPA